MKWIQCLVVAIFLQWDAPSTGSALQSFNGGRGLGGWGGGGSKDNFQNLLKHSLYKYQSATYHIEGVSVHVIENQVDDIYGLQCLPMRMFVNQFRSPESGH